MRTYVLQFAAIVLFLSGAPAAQSQSFMQLVSDPLTGEYCVPATEGQVSTVYLCLWTPVNPSFDDAGVRAVANVGGFECRFVEERNVSVVSIDYPVAAIDVGTYDSHIVGYTVPVPVAENGPYGSFVVLATLDVLFSETSDSVRAPESKSPTYCDGATGYLSLSPTIPYSSVEGAPSFLDADDPTEPIVAAEYICGFDESCVLYFLNTTVPNDAASWDGVKAMYK